MGYPMFWALSPLQCEVRRAWWLWAYYGPGEVDDVPVPGS